MSLWDTNDGAAQSCGPASTISPQAVRITPLRPSSVPPRPNEPVVSAITDLLLAAGHADGELCRRERKAVRRLICELLGVEAAPEWVLHRIEHFDPGRFELSRATVELRSLLPEEKRFVLEAARRVCDANNAYDLEEETFLSALVLALECTPQENDDLIVDQSPSLEGWGKRAFDIVFALTFLVCAWPLLLLLAVAVKVTSPGPALFKQKRYGRQGREILVWKFRTMRVMEEGLAVRQATRDDPRVTPLGAFMRRTSLDELPQFVNVLFGDMSVVGPRPHAIAHNRFYRTQILEYMLRHKVKPGVTGWAQINGWRGETDTLEKMIQRVAFDLEYIRRHSLWLDVTIVYKTVFGGSARQNAY